MSEVEDNSGKSRDFTSSGTYPTIKTNAVNSKKSFVFTRSTNPLTWTGTPFKAACGYLVVKINSLLNYDGILTGATDNPILVANHGNEKFFNSLYPYQEVRVNDWIYRMNADVDEFPPVVQDEWQIIYFNFWKPITISSLQIGQDRADTTRRTDMEVAALALYSNYYFGTDKNNGEQAIRKNYESFAHSYQIPIYTVFPFNASLSDTGERGAFIVTDGQPVAKTRPTSDPFWTYDANLLTRDRNEFRKALEFYDARAYTGQTFLFRQFTDLAHDQIHRFDPDVKFQWKGNLASGRRSYGFSVIESDTEPLKYIPDKPDFSGVPVVDTIPPSNVTNLSATAIKPQQIDLEFDPATDNSGFISGYQIQRAESNTFPLGAHSTIILPLYTNVVIEDGKVVYSDKTVSADNEYFYRVKAFDRQPNFSVNWSGIASATTPAIPDTTAPTVNLLAPPSTVAGTVTLSATANDTESGVQRVEFYIIPPSGTPSRKLGEQTTPNTGTNQYDFEWNTAQDALGNAIADGTYTIGAISFDYAANMSSPSFRPLITVANNVNQAPTLAPITLTPGDNQIVADFDFADTDGTVEKIYVEISASGANQFSPKGVDWETVQDGVTPDTTADHQFIVTELGGIDLDEGETVHFRAWVEDNDGSISARRFANAATNPPASGGGSDFAQTDDIGAGSDFIMTDFGDFVQTDSI